MFGTLEVHQWTQKVVPDAHEGKERDHRNRRARQGKNDAPENAELTAPIDAGGFGQLRGLRGETLPLNPSSDHVHDGRVGDTERKAKMLSIVFYFLAGYKSFPELDTANLTTCRNIWTTLAGIHLKWSQL